MTINVTIQGGWCDGKTVTIPDGRDTINLLEEPRPWFHHGPYTTAESMELLASQITLPLEHIAENEYLARWPVREDPRYCPQCACPPESALRSYTRDNWQCRCRFGHAWTVHRRNLANFPPPSWPKALR